MIIPTTESTLRMTLMQLSETKLELAAVTEQRDDFKKELEIANLRLKGKRHSDDNGIMADGEIDVKAVTEQRDAASAEFYRYHGLWDRATKQLETVMYQRDRLAETNNRVIELLKDGLQTDGSHHKQWYLNEVLKLINADIAKDVEMHWTHDRGIAP